MKKTLLVSAIALALCSQAQADNIGIYAGAYSWQPELSGDGNLGNYNYDLDSDDNATSYYVAFEHPIPLLPNARLQRTDLSSRSKDSTELDLSHTDATLYYNILDNWVHFDLGLTGRFFDGKVDNGIQKASIDDTVPMLYANMMVELPFNLYAGITGNVARHFDNDTEIYDFTARVGWEAILGLGVEAGYRTFDTKMKDLKHAEVDSSMKGPYLGLSYHF
ncbi:outer membrane protein [Sinobacterium caligoides]|uniref:Outer membrane protein n=1 Tax=Sinobacterium caligoides TaxID=933926 RepID=A0A3N2DG83_9GAMM|nr:TIGR04219 family outer membrane beta-barrel protein [Sinobacterium caligoides]ROR98802.1 outer membrane protein [Sinobacterium caligoides]